MKYLLLYLLVSLAVADAGAQRCEIISMDHFGGNLGELLVPPYFKQNSNGSVGVTFSSSSTSGSVRTDCPMPVVQGFAGVCRWYDPTFTTLLGQDCGGIAANFIDATFYIYPQPNGDTIFIGQGEVSNSQELAIERRNGAAVAWNKIYGGGSSELLRQVVDLGAEGFLVTMEAYSSDGDVGLHYGGWNLPDIWILRLDTDGNILWKRVLGGSGSDIPCAAQAAADGGFYIFAGTYSSDHDIVDSKGAPDLFVAKLDSAGNKEWTKCYGGTGNDGSAFDMAIHAIADGSGGFYILSRTDSQDGQVQQRQPDDVDFWLLHINAAGDLLWENTYGGPYRQYPSAFCRAADGSFWMGGKTYQDFIGGMIDVTYGKADVWIVHTDSMGNFINQRVLGNTQDDALMALHPLPDNTVMAVGCYVEAFGETSPGFPATVEGGMDVFMARLGPHTVSVEDEQATQFHWELFPNPSTTQVHIVVHGAAKRSRLTVRNSKGNIIYRNTVKDRLVIPTKEWVPGLYLVEIVDSKGNASTKKLSQH